ncbi:hypothetical protein [Streptosporangium canum]
MAEVIYQVGESRGRIAAPAGLVAPAHLAALAVVTALWARTGPAVGHSAV